MEYVHLLKIHLISLFESACVLCWGKFALSMISTVVVFLLGVENSMLFAALVTLITFDLITGGLMVPFKIGTPIESVKILKTVSKLVAYSLFISAAHLTENIVPGTTFIDITALSYLALTEFVSIMENLGTLGYSMPQKLLNRVKELKNER